MSPRLPLSPAQLAEFCRTHRIRRLSVFGSALRDHFRPDSDLDLLVEFEPGHRIGLIGIAGLEHELSALVGRTVDLRTPEDLSPLFRDDVLRSAVVQYAA